MTKRATPRVALVYPPYGPPNLPSLGLAILSAAAKGRGFDCRTFFWHYRFTEALPLRACTMQQKLKIYAMLTQWNFFPWNEWVFARRLLPELLSQRDAEVRQGLARLDSDTAALFAAGFTGNLRPSQLILYLHRHVDRLLSEMACELEPYDIIGIGASFFQNGPALALSRHLKARWPGKTIVLGGANCDGEMGRALIENFPFVDYVFSGEADRSFPEFLRCVREGTSVHHIPGILFRDGAGKIVAGPRGETAGDMDELPAPDFDDYIAERKRFGLYDGADLCLPLESSRGCWWGAKSHCTFCGLNANGLEFRQKSPARFQAEVEAVAGRYGARYFFMADNILPAKYYGDVLPALKQRKSGVNFFYEIRANASRKQVAELAGAGITMVQPGIESFSTAVLALMRKRMRGIQNIAFLKYARDYGLFTVYNLLAGFPGEDPAEYSRMAGEIPKLLHLPPPSGVTGVRFDRFSPYRESPGEFGIRLRPHRRYSFVYPFKEETVARLAYVFEQEGTFEESYLQDLRAAVSRWRALFSADRCTLTWKFDGNDILIADRRPGFTPCDYRLRKHAAAAYRALDEPKTLARALRDSASLAACEAAPTGENTCPASPQIAEREVSFSADDFSIDPLSCIRPLIDAGLIYEEDGWYVTLPVAAGHRKIDAGWARLNI